MFATYAIAFACLAILLTREIGLGREILRFQARQSGIDIRNGRKPIDDSDEFIQLAQN